MARKGLVTFVRFVLLATAQLQTSLSITIRQSVPRKYQGNVPVAVQALNSADRGAP
jgi:hypothetical protein